MAATRESLVNPIIQSTYGRVIAGIWSLCVLALGVNPYLRTWLPRYSRDDCGHNWDCPGYFEGALGFF